MDVKTAVWRSLPENRMLQRCQGAKFRKNLQKRHETNIVTNVLTGMEETEMWYVIQTFGGQEEETADMIRNVISSIYIEECFVPKRERMKKFQGCWHMVEEILFPGYVFGITDRPGELYQDLRRIPKLCRLLGREDEYFVPLNEEEESLVRRLGGKAHRTGISRVEVLEGKRIRVVEGPLKDYMGDVVKVNLHKREVAVQVEFMGRPVELYMGIEMVGAGDCGE